MMRLIIRGLGLLLLILLLVPAGFSRKLPRKSKKELKKADNATSTTSSPEITASSDSAKVDETGASEPTSTAATSPAVAALPTRGTANDNKGTNDDYKPLPKFTPLLATTGTIGLFTLETADTIPKHGFAFSAFGNKFGRLRRLAALLDMWRTILLPLIIPVASGI